jgi:glycosyltransferase involved in cell wall biosynthesis
VRIVIVSGIWPPDVGGPASHAPALARFLTACGHDVEVVTTADAEPAAEAFPVSWVSRRLPPGVRHAAVVVRVVGAARRREVVYATSMVHRCALAAALARRPLVVKLVSDPAYERARRRGAFTGTLEEFQRWPGGRLQRRVRTAALRRAACVVVPSAYLRQIALGWGIDARCTAVVPNPAPEAPVLPLRNELRGSYGSQSGTLLAFAGRLTEQKDVDTLLAAMRGLPDATLVLLGDGPERSRLERLAQEYGLGERTRFLGAGEREDVLRLSRAADAVVLSSTWENLPHTVVEALSVGTPVVATAVGGVPEVVEDGVNGLLVPPGDVEALAEALRRLVEEAGLRDRLAAAAAPSVAHLREPEVLARIEALIAEALA